MSADHFGIKFKNWRLGQGFKQSTVAGMLDVTQAAISRWENGHDMPSLALCRRIENIMLSDHQAELAIERAFVARNASMQAIFDLDGIRLKGLSAGMRSTWPLFSVLEEHYFADHLIGESSILIKNDDILNGVLSKDIIMMSGVSKRHISISVDPEMVHKWHARFRTIGSRIMADVLYEPCDENAELKILDIIRRDDLVR